MTTEYKGQCPCGAVHFTYTSTEETKPMFSAICHCLNCRKANGTSPHLLGVPKTAFAITKGEEDSVKHYDITPKLQRFFCQTCGTGIYQGPKGAPFVAVFPTNFDILRVQFPKDVPDFFQVTKQFNCENAWSNAFEGKDVGERCEKF